MSLLDPLGIDFIKFYDYIRNLYNSVLNLYQNKHDFTFLYIGLCIIVCLDKQNDFNHRSKVICIYSNLLRNDYN